jgi:putative FmdB family regulatory protein
MPRYDYACAACGRRFEVVHGISEDGPTGCPLCGEGPVRKAFAPPAIHFKGTGWAKKERRASSAARSSTSGDGAGESTATPAAADSKGGDAASGAAGSSSAATTKDASAASGSTD